MESFGDFVWLVVLTFLFIAYLLIFFNILVDLFVRDHKTAGWIKAVWVFFLIVIPYLTAFVYLIVRCQGLAGRAKGEAEAARLATDAHVSESGDTSTSPTHEIALAKSLLDAGAITAEEFASLKAQALREIDSN